MKFYLRLYGRRIFGIEAILLIAATTIFLVGNLWLPAGSLLNGPSILIFLFLVFTHMFTFLTIARLEWFPLATIRLDRFHSLFYKALLLSFIASFGCVFSLGSYFPATVLLGNLTYEILQIYTLTVLFMLVVLIPVPLASLDKHNKARLCFRTVLVGLKLIYREPKKKERTKLVKKYIRYFRDGLNSYNSFLYKNAPTHIEIVDIDGYYCRVCSVSLIGNKTEQNTVIRQIRRVLDAMGGKIREGNLRELLNGLGNIKKMKENNEFTLPELNELIKVLSFSERVKERLKSPYFTTAVSLIAVALAALRFIFK